MSNTSKARAKSSIPLQSLLTALSNTIRWRVYDEIHRNGGMTALPLSNKLGVKFSAMTKHLHFLRDLGLLDQGMGKVYTIPPRFLVPGERTLDFGPVVLRLDQGGV